MKALILAAGEGRRMLPLTLDKPKSLLEVHGKTLIEHHILNLVAANIVDIVINLHYLGNMIEQRLGDGRRYGANIVYSYEETLLETAGGIKHALPLIGADEFIVLSSDIYTDYDFSLIRDHKLVSNAHLVMVQNPAHHPLGDFLLSDGYLQIKPAKIQGLTWMSIGKFKASCFSDLDQGPLSLRSVFDVQISQSAITAEQYSGAWIDVGTVERLALCRKQGREQG